MISFFKYNYNIYIVLKYPPSPLLLFMYNYQVDIGYLEEPEYSKDEFDYSDVLFRDIFDGDLDMVCEINIQKNKFIIQDSEQRFFIRNSYEFEEGKQWRFVICRYRGY